MRYLLLFSVFLLCACSNSDDATPLTEMYFPPNNSSAWETVTPEALGWNEAVIPELEQFIRDTGTRGLIILKNGRIVFESYDGLTLDGINRFGQNNYWYWASAGKTLTSFLIGQAEAQQLLSLDDPSNTYLGQGWSSLNTDQENAISVRHHLTMTTGLDFNVSDPNCTDPECLQFLNAPGDQWFYHNAPYTILDQVIEGASNQSFDDFFEEQLLNKIGMEGFWEYIGFNHIFFSPPRSMARFGLLILAEGSWNGEPILNNETFFQDMINTSQPLNPSYGYLWWLNGKSAFIPPGITNLVSGDISLEAPEEMIAAIGANGQLINIVPSQQLVVIRMGNATDDSLVPFSIQNQLWDILNELIVE
ncbi:MAG: serine hydrolase [Cytophagales bacterium]|nr:serine hydrolase [Cytophagales bacterium]